MNNTFEADTSQLLLYPVNSEDEKVELGATSWEKRMSNELESFNRAGTGNTLAQNLNKVEENHIFNALVSDEFIELSDANDNITNKEAVDIKMEQIFTGNTRITVEYSYFQKSGYIVEYNIEEVSQNDMSTFRITFTLLVAEPMSGSD